MNKIVCITLVVLWFSNNTKAQSIQIVKFNELKQRVFNHSDTTYVVNFFASWCKPCLDEMPTFIEFIDSTKNTKIKVLFISMDSKNELDKNLKKVVEKYNLPPIYLLDEPSGNNWINYIDKNWSGTIPATLIVKKGRKKHFITSTITFQNLINLTE
jgi:thiol-disulfide isomerase/thioredoxin